MRNDLKKYLIEQGYKQLLTVFVKQLIKDYNKGLVNSNDLKIIFRCLDIYEISKVKSITRKRLSNDKLTEETSLIPE